MAFNIWLFGFFFPEILRTHIKSRWYS
jgi:hypothetical protein